MLGELLTAVAGTQPEKPALIARSSHVPYWQFDARAHRLAQGLLRLGLQQGDRVAFQLPNGIDAALCHFACFKSGLVGVPCHTRLTSAEIAFALEHSEARVYVCSHESYRRVTAAKAELPALEHIVLVDDDQLPAGALSFQALSRANGARLAPLAPVAPHADALILYTSGTAARPKGVLHTHASLREGTRLFVRAAELRSDDRVLLMSSMTHMSGVCQLIATVSIGGVAAIVPAMDASAALDALEQVGCTHSFGLPVAYQLLLQEQQRAPRRVRTIRSALGGGDSLTPALIDAFQSAFGVPIQEGHGMTECAPNLCNPRVGLRAGSMGHALPGVTVRVDAAPGEAGELLLRTPALFDRYWRDDAETRQAFKDGFLRTGDLVRVDADGFHWFAGRRTEIIVHGGVNVSPQEVEEALCRHPAVEQAGVVGVPDPLWGESVQAFVVLKSGASATGHEVRDFLAERLADWKVPGSIVVEQELPIGPTGKIQRRLLRKRALAAMGAPES